MVGEQSTICMTRSQGVGLLRIPLWEFAESNSASKINERDGVVPVSRNVTCAGIGVLWNYQQYWDRIGIAKLSILMQ